MGEENAPLAYAVLFGDRTQVSDDILTSYNNAGILHLLAVSGLHVGFIAGLIYALLSKLKLKRLFSFIITACLLLFYNYLCNFTPSVVRATIMICVGLFANVLGKKSDTLTTIGIAGILTLLIKPLWAFDIGFQLSYFKP